MQLSEARWRHTLEHSVKLSNMTPPRAPSPSSSEDVRLVTDGCSVLQVGHSNLDDLPCVRAGAAHSCGPLNTDGRS